MTDRIGRTKIRVFHNGRHHLIQITHNGSQWQSINLDDIKDVRLLWQAMGTHLGEEDFNFVKLMPTKKLIEINKKISAELQARSG
jgi:hypothetical protein